MMKLNGLTDSTDIFVQLPQKRGYGQNEHKRFSVSWIWITFAKKSVESVESVEFFL